MFALNKTNGLAHSASCVKRNLQRGFSMLEILISVVVLSIGLLGVAGLQLTSLKQADSANLRSQATILSYDIIDKMHANRAHALYGSYSIPSATLMPLPVPPWPLSVPPSSTIPASDLASWLGSLAISLPSGTGTVAVDANGIATITVQWDDSRGDGSSTETFQLSTAL